jgi:CheY-like chemotaxis protein
VLVAEDNPADVSLIRLALKHHQVDAELTVQTDGEHMLRYIERMEAGEVLCPDLVLLDLNLPRVTGHALLQRLRESPICGQVPILIVSSSDTQRDRYAAIRLGATGYFCKPNDYDKFMQLGQLVTKLLRTHPLE